MQKDGNSNEDKSCVCRDFDEEFYNKTAVSEVAQVSCVKYSVENGIVTAYVGIKVPMKELIKKVAEIRKMFLKDRLPEKKPTNVENVLCPAGYQEAGKGRCCPTGMIFINNKCQVSAK